MHILLLLLLTAPLRAQEAGPASSSETAPPVLVPGEDAAPEAGQDEPAESVDDAASTGHGEDEAPTPELTGPASAEEPPTLETESEPADSHPLDPPAIEPRAATELQPAPASVHDASPGHPEEPAHPPSLGHRIEPQSNPGAAPSAPPSALTPQAPYLAEPYGWLTTAPSPPTPTAPAQVSVHTAPSPLAAYLLPLPERGAGTAMRFLFWLLLMLLVDAQLHRFRARLLPEGVLPTSVALLSQALRLVALFAALLVIAALLPPSLLPILPLAMLGGALAIGVSVWTVLPDVWSGVMLSVEQRLQPGQWIRVGELAGEIERIGYRATTIRDRHGTRVLIPNRRLGAEAIAADEVRWPEVEIDVPVPTRLSPEQVRAVLDEAVMLSPFLAPACDPALMQREFTPPVWRVRARIVEAHWADEFEGALRERVRELLEEP